MNRLRGNMTMERNVLIAVIDTLKAKSALNNEANLGDMHCEKEIIDKARPNSLQLVARLPVAIGPSR